MPRYRDDILAIVVLYKQSLASSLSFTTLEQSLSLSGIKITLFVYDNSPEAQTIIPDTPYFDIVYRHDKTNPGVSKAYNEGAKYASDHQKKWMLLLDQDTHFPENAVASYIKAIEQHSHISLFVPILQTSNGIYSPAKSYWKRGVIWKNVTPGIHKLKHKMALNSGIFVSTALFWEAGGYKESIRLHYSDFYFIDKVKKKIDEFCVIDIVCQHDISTLSATDREKALAVFASHCEGAFRSIENVYEAIQFYTVVGIRAIKLSMQFRTLDYLKIFIAEAKKNS
jgi:hypothetical protein